MREYHLLVTMEASLQPHQVLLGMFRTVQQIDIIGRMLASGSIAQTLRGMLGRLCTWDEYSQVAQIEDGKVIFLI